MARNNPVLLTGPTRGLDGRSVLAKARAPLITDGRIGDFWIDTVSKKLYGPKNAGEWPDNGLIRGPQGWAPKLVAEADGTRRVFKISDWTGGEGAKPDTGYLAGDGTVVPNIADAADFRGVEGPQALINALDAKTDAVTYETLTALAEGASDNEKAAVKRVFEPGGEMPFKAVSDAQAANVPKAIGRLRIGYDLYQRVASEPDSGLKFRTTDRWTDEGNSDSANGGWWEVSREALTTAKVLRYRRYDVSLYGADPDASSARNTVAIQRAINSAFADGGGEVFLPLKSSGVFKTQGSTETTLLGGIGTGPVFVASPASDVVSLVLRSGVHLIADDGVVIENQDNNKSILALVGMESGGIQGGWFRSLWDWNAPVGAGHGIVAYCLTDPNADPMQNLRIDDVRVSNVASYGFGMGMGFMRNNRYSNLWVHDVGADAFDHKARPDGERNPPVGNVLTNILAERYGRRVVSSCAVDIRGPMIVQNVVAREVAYASNGNVGVRLSPGIYTPGAGVIDSRWPSQEAIVTNVNLGAGDPTISGTIGIMILDSGGLVDGGHVTNFDIGVTFRDSPSGWGSNKDCLVHGVTVEGARAKSFEMGSKRVAVIGCTALGQNERFEEKAGNLVAGQTVFVSPRPFNTSTVRVYKNEVRLTLTTDYVVTDDETITLVSGVLLSDVIEIASPTPVGFSDIGDYSRVRNCRTRDVTQSHSSGSTLFDVGGNLFEGDAFEIDYGTSSSLVSELRGPASAIEREFRAKGAAGHTLRSRGARALRAVNNLDNCVNWLQVQGSTAGNPVDIVASGSDANINLRLNPKGSTGFVQVPIGNIPNHADSAAAAAGGVPLGGIFRSGSTLRVRDT